MKNRRVFSLNDLMALSLLCIFLWAGCSRAVVHKPKNDGGTEDDLAQITPDVSAGNDFSSIVINDAPATPDAGALDQRLPIDAAKSVSDTISSSVPATALGRTSQRKTFSDPNTGLHWAFYYSGSAIAYSYSADYTSWNYGGTRAYNTTDFAIAYRVISGATYVVLTAVANNFDVVVERGILGPTGITWDSSPAKIFSGSSASDRYELPTVAFDNNGYVWAATAHRNYLSGALPSRVFVTRSTNTAASSLSNWQTATALTERIASVLDLAIVPRTQSQMALIVNSAQLHSYFFDGTSWTAQHPTEASSFSPMPAAGVDLPITCMLKSGSNIYVGGEFVSIDGDTRMSHIAKWNGSNWEPLASGINGTVNAMVELGGILYVGGIFSRAGGRPVSSLARWDGFQWTALGNDSYEIYSLATLGNDLYVLGYFQSLGKTLRKWDGTTWTNVGAYNHTNTGIAMTIVDNIVYVLNSTSVSKLISTGWVSGSGSLPTNCSAKKLAVIGEDIYIGGTKYSSPCTSGLMKWTPSGWVAPGNGVNGSVSILKVSGNALYVGGSFTQAGGNLANGIAKWDGSAWTTFGSGVSGNGYFRATNNYLGTVFDLELVGTDLYVGGDFLKAGSSSVTRFAKYSGATWSDPTIKSASDLNGLGANGDIEIMISDGTNLYVGGSFSKIGAIEANNIAKWNGTSWTALGTGVNATVKGLAVMGGQVYVIGTFTEAGGKAANKIAKWDGSSWSNLGTGPTGTSGIVGLNGIAANATEVYVVGNFSSFSGVTAKNIAKWDGTGWTALGSGLTGEGFAIAVSGSNVYVSSDYSPIRKWDGSTWTNMGTNYYMVDSIVATSSTVFAGNYDGIYYWDGSLWQQLSTLTNHAVPTLSIWGSDLYVGISYTNYFGAYGRSSAYSNYLQKWNGTNWSNIGVFDGYIHSIAPVNDTLYIGGPFVTVNNFPSAHLARLKSSGNLAPGSAIGISLVADPTNGDLHLAMGSNTNTEGVKLGGTIYRQAFAGQTSYRKFSSGSWSAPTVLATAPSEWPAVSLDPGNGDVFVYWLENKILKRKKYSAGAWSAVSTLTATGTAANGLNAAQEKFGGIVKVLVNDITTSSSKLIMKADGS